MVKPDSTTFAECVEQRYIASQRSHEMKLRITLIPNKACGAS
jgi:hypothetical protein